MAGTVVHLRAHVDRQDAIARAAAGELLGAAELQAIFDLRKSRFYELETEGAFDVFRVHPPIGPNCYSGRKLTAYLNGELVRVESSVFRKRKRSRR